MIKNRQETIADIVAQMRLGVKDWRGERVGVFDCFADRIEAAWKREREAGADAAQICGEIGEMIGREASKNQSVTNCNRFGNVAKMREALLEASIALSWATHNHLTSGDAEKYLKIVDDTLSAPPRNCDRPECSTTKASQEVWRKEDGGMTAYYEWLLATSTKGDAK